MKNTTPNGTGINKTRLFLVVGGICGLSWMVAQSNAGAEDVDKAAPAAAQAVEQPAAKPDAPASPWLVSEDVSPIDDSKTVVLLNTSKEMVKNRFGRNQGPATMVLRCQENTTALYINFAGQFMASSRYNNYGDVTYRVDGEEAVTVGMDESTDHQSLGLFTGGQSIPMIKRMIGHDQIVVRATPYNESPLTLTFDISGLDKDISTLRETCGW